MDATRPETIHYKRSRFSTRLPQGRLYSPAHYWIAEQQSEQQPELWRVGFTKFATRMLGDVVEYGFEVQPGDAVEVGQRIAWVEGFKALTDVYCVVAGEFTAVNARLDEDITRLDSDPYVQGWLYEVRGTPDSRSLDVHAYMTLLDAIIDKMLQQGQV